MRVLRQVQQALRWERRGSGTVEFALVAVVLVTLTFAVLDLGRWAYLNSAVLTVAQEAARQAAGDPSLSPDTIKTRALARAPALDPGQLTLTVERRAATREVVVTAQYPYTPITPFIPVGRVSVVKIVRFHY